MKKFTLVSVALGWLLLVGPGLIHAAPTGKKATRCLAKHQKQVKRYVTAGMDEFKRLKHRQALAKIDRAVSYAEARGCHQHSAYARALAAKAVVYYDGKHDHGRAFGLLAQAFKIDHTVTLAGTPSSALVRTFNDVRLAAHAEKNAKSKTVRTRSKKARRLARRRWNQRLARVARLGFRHVTDSANSTHRYRLRHAARLAAAGNKLLKKNKISAAYKAYRKSLVLAPNNLAVRERFGVVQFRLGDFSGALRTVQWIRKHAGDTRADRLLKRKTTR
jgi:tetratricopeptide (TPR) repeat protein